MIVTMPVHSEREKCLKRFGMFIRTNLLTILTVGGVILGIVIGLLVRQTNNGQFTQREVYYIGYIGELFLRMLKALILPLIISSLVASIGSLDLGLSGKVGARAILYYSISTGLAVILGIVLAVTIKPGVGSEAAASGGQDRRNVTTVDTLLDLVKNMFPPNLVQACFQQHQTVLKPPKVFVDDLYQWNITSEFVDGMNIMGLVVASCVLGIAIASSRGQAKYLLEFFEESNLIIMKITSWVIWLSPVGVMFLITAKLLEMENLNDLVGQLGLYFVTVAGGVLVHGFIVLPFIFFIFTRTNPYAFIGKLGQVMATAFGTSSSSASLPITIQCLEENLNMDPRIARFVIPIGATINMDGTALYEAVAAIFIAQVRGISLTLGSIIAISITATAASIGAAGIPQAGLVTMVMVLDTVGLPAEDVSLIIAVDWLLDRFRTVVNVMGDTLGAGIVAHLSKKELEEIDAQNLQKLENHAHSCDTIVMEERIQINLS